MTGKSLAAAAWVEIVVVCAAARMEIVAAVAAAAAVAKNHAVDLAAA